LAPVTVESLALDLSALLPAFLSALVWSESSASGAWSASFSAEPFLPECLVLEVFSEPLADMPRSGPAEVFVSDLVLEPEALDESDESDEEDEEDPPSSATATAAEPITSAAPTPAEAAPMTSQFRTLKFSERRREEPLAASDATVPTWFDSDISDINPSRWTTIS
jgi:hypothetical protein